MKIKTLFVATTLVVFTLAVPLNASYVRAGIVGGIGGVLMGAGGVLTYFGQYSQAETARLYHQSNLVVAGYSAAEQKCRSCTNFFGQGPYCVEYTYKGYVLQQYNAIVNATIQTFDAAPEAASCADSEAGAIATAQQVVPRSSSIPIWYLISNPSTWTLDPTSGDIYTVMSVAAFAAGGATLVAAVCLAVYERHRRVNGDSYAVIE